MILSVFSWLKCATTNRLGLVHGITFPNFAFIRSLYFLQGQEVDDFLILNKDFINTISISALHDTPEFWEKLQENTYFGSNGNGKDLTTCVGAAAATACLRAARAVQWPALFFVWSCVLLQQQGVHLQCHPQALECGAMHARTNSVKVEA